MDPMAAMGEHHDQEDLSFGLPDRLKKARHRARIVTGQMVADDLGVERQTVSNWENGHTQARRYVIRYYAEQFGVTEAYLKGEEKAPGKRRRPAKRRFAMQHRRVFLPNGLVGVG